MPALYRRKVLLPLEIMALVDVVVPQPPTSPRPPDTPPVSPAYTPPEGPGVHGSLQFGTIDRFEYAVEKLVRALGKAGARNQTEDAKLEAAKDIEVEKPKIQASKLEYKMVDEVYVG